MKKILMLIMLIVTIGCSEQNIEVGDLSINGEIAKNYIESKGYEVVAFEKEEQVIFAKEDMSILPHQQFWSVQTIEPDDYLNKELTTIDFLVRNHPLSNQYESDKARISIILNDNEVIGGTSYPYSKEPLVGVGYSLDGKTAEEVKGDYSEWLIDWKAKYGTK